RSMFGILGLPHARAIKKPMMEIMGSIALGPAPNRWDGVPILLCLSQGKFLFDHASCARSMASISPSVSLPRTITSLVFSYSFMARNNNSFVARWILIPDFWFLFLTSI